MDPDEGISSAQSSPLPSNSSQLPSGMAAMDERPVSRRASLDGLCRRLTRGGKAGRSGAAYRDAQSTEPVGNSALGPWGDTRLRLFQFALKFRLWAERGRRVATAGRRPPIQGGFAGTRSHSHPNAAIRARGRMILTPDRFPRPRGEAFPDSNAALWPTGRRIRQSGRGADISGCPRVSPLAPKPLPSTST